MVQSIAKEGEEIRLSLVASGGASRWPAPLVVAAQRTSDSGPHYSGDTVAMMRDLVAICPPGGPVTFYDRKSGAKHSEHTGPVFDDPHRTPEYDRRSCSLMHRDGTLFMETEQGGTLFAVTKTQ